jgi:hypothetical protein
MSGEQLIVKLPWKFRNRTQSTRDNTPVRTRDPSKEPTSKTAKYALKLKQNCPARYEALKQTDADRKKAAYVNVADMDENERVVQKKKWADARKRQRQLKKHGVPALDNVDNDSSTDGKEQEKKRYKHMTSDEKKHYHKKKMRETRMNMSRQKNSAIHTQDRARKQASASEQESTCSTMSTPTTSGKHGTGTPKTTRRRHRRKIHDVMPKDPDEYAEVVETLVSGTPATPRKVTTMANRGIGKKRIEVELIAGNIRKNIAHHTKSTSNRNRQALYAIIKASTDSSHGSAKLKRYLGVSNNRVQNLCVPAYRIRFKSALYVRFHNVALFVIFTTVKSVC